MGANAFGKILATWLVLGLAGVAAAQPLPAGSEDGLRPSWSDSAMADGWRAICGDVRNVRPVAARSVALRVEGHDGAGNVVSARDRYVAADVPAGSRAVFCVPMPAGAASYNVTVVGADWVTIQGP